MSKNKYTCEEIVKFSQNVNVLRCTGNMVIYTYEFKKGALEQYNQGVGSREIWRKAGFDPSRWKKTYFKDTIKDWKGIVRKRGFEGLAKLQGSQATGRPKTKGVTDADKIKRLELQVRYLRAENDFLIRLRAKRAESNSGQNKNSRSSKN
jgi:transposase-like protein